MNIPDIIEVKNHLEDLKKKALIEKWELPYENILTRRTAAIFFITPLAEDKEESIWQEMEKYDHFSVRVNKETNISTLQYRLTFSSEEKQKNELLQSAELVKRLSAGNHPVQANRPEKTAKALKERINLGYLHIFFKETGTGLDIKLNMHYCDFSGADFAAGAGIAHIEGGVTLNYEKVKCVADITLATMEGTGFLVPVNEEEYYKLMNVC